MAREFNRNLFIMLLSIMVGAILITFFAADIVKQSQFDIERKQYAQEISDVTTEKNIFENRSRNFTDHFFKSLGSLDLSREDRSQANSYFDFAASIWYPAREYQKVIDNCTLAMQSYLDAYDNFLDTKTFFNDTKAYTDEAKYITILDIYIGLSDAGANISLLRYDSCKYLIYIAENLSLYADANITDLENLFNETEALYFEALGLYNDLIDEIEYEYSRFFNPDRETA